MVVKEQGLAALAGRLADDDRMAGRFADGGAEPSLAQHLGDQFRTRLNADVLG